jgi:hypothetical protein
LFGLQKESSRVHLQTRKKVKEGKLPLSGISWRQGGLIWRDFLFIEYNSLGEYIL